MAAVPNPRFQVLQAGRVLRETELPRDGELLLGRTEQCDLQVDDSTVSRMHARLTADRHGVYLEDLGSANGTFVDDAPLQGTIRLEDGAIVRLGQKAATDPILLRFVDPAKQLLSDMGLLPTGDEEDAADPEPEPPPSAPPARTSPATPAAAVPAAREAVPETDRDDDPDVDDELPAEPLEAPVGRRPFLLRPVGLALVFVLLLAVVAVLFWASRALAPSAAAWRTVQLSSREVAPGDTLRLAAADIEAGAEVRLFLDGTPIEDLRVLPGRLEATVPGLADRGAGTHSVTLVAQEGERQVFRETLTYTVRPRLDGVEPDRVEVGQTFRLVGTSLPELRGAARVRVGDAEATVISASTTAIEAQVPAITRDRIVQATVSLVGADFEVQSPELLVVAPRTPRPLQLELAATPTGDDGLWEVSTPLGAAFYLPADGSASLEARMAEIGGRLREALAAAAVDPGLVVEVSASRGSYAFRANSPERSRPLPLFELSEESLAAWSRSHGSQAPPGMVAFWMAGVWSQVLDVVGRGRVPEGDAPHTAALARLVRSNREAGGSGRPEVGDLEALPGAERRALALAFSAMPATFGDAGGRWRARLQDVFYGEGDYAIDLDLEITQRRGRLSGQGRVTIQGPTMTYQVPASPLSGTFHAELPPRVEIELDFRRPIGHLRLEGTLEGDTLSGTFRSRLERSTGEWKAVRSGG